MQLQEKFIALLHHHQGILHKICHVYRAKEIDREDLFQEIALQAWKAYPSFKGESKFSTWLYRVSINTAISYCRKEGRQPLMISTDVFPDIPEDIDDTNAQFAAMYQHMEALSEVDKAILVLFLEDYSYEEIGELLGITANNVAVKMNRIKTKLRAEVQKHSGV